MRELVVPLCVLFVLATLLLPMPAGLLDFMLVTNIILALVLLVSTLYVNDPIKLSALPSILLLATMYRLALNVSTTRRILSGNEPGQMIEAFGTIVVNDNLLVGLIVFIVITLVQFIVIAKGSERVAEVAARFTLDALPGKQMSIDADMRSGILEVGEARRKRQEIQIESRFYGALDGSMKFVKGDAIAGMVITAINLVGGILIGMTVFNLELTTSVERFSLLTVGDGLLSQIPALLNSLAAGMIVTRVTTEGSESNLAADVITQLGQIRAVKILIACLAIALSFAPGMPAFSFWILAGILAMSSLLDSSNVEIAAHAKGENGCHFLPRLPDLISITIDRAIIAKIEKPALLTEKVDLIRQQLFNELGLLLPAPKIELVDDPPAAYSLFIRGLPSSISNKNCVANHSLVDNLAADLKLLILARAPEMVDDVMTRRLLDYYEEVATEQVASLVPDLFTVTTITTLLRDLIQEGVSIQPFDLIMQAIAENGKPGNSRKLLATVRIALARHIG